MIPLAQVRDHIVRPALDALGLWTKSAELQVIGTGLIESNYDYVAQVRGPALGFFQMEPVTCQDCWDNYLASRQDLRLKVITMMARQDRIGQLAWNAQYAAAMCRIKYLRAPIPMPSPNDLNGMAQMWKDVYNSSQGAGDSQAFVTRATANNLLSI